MGFCSLQHMKDRRSTCRGFADPLRSAFRVWLPSWRFPPFDPVPVFFHTGSARGIHPSERSSLERFPGCYHPDAPTYRFAHRCSRRRSVGPAQSAPVPGVQPFRKSLAAGRGFSSPPAGCSLGFRPSRVFRRKPRTGFRPPSSHALCRRGDESPRPPAPQSVDQLSAGFLHVAHRSAFAGERNPSRVLAPARSRTFEQGSFRAMRSPHTVPGIATRQPVIFGWMPSLYRSCRHRLGCRAFATSTSQM